MLRIVSRIQGNRIFENRRSFTFSRILTLAVKLRSSMCVTLGHVISREGARDECWIPLWRGLLSADAERQNHAAQVVWNVL